MSICLKLEGFILMKLCSCGLKILENFNTKIIPKIFIYLKTLLVSPKLLKSFEIFLIANFSLVLCR